MLYTYVHIHISYINYRYRVNIWFHRSARTGTFLLDKFSPFQYLEMRNKKLIMKWNEVYCEYQTTSVLLLFATVFLVYFLSHEHWSVLSRMEVSRIETRKITHNKMGKNSEKNEVYLTKWRHLCSQCDRCKYWRNIELDVVPTWTFY